MLQETLSYYWLENMHHHTVKDITAPKLECVESNTPIEQALEEMFNKGIQQMGVDVDGEFAGIVSHRDITRLLNLSNQMDQSDSVLQKPIIMAVNRSFETVNPDDEIFTLFDKLADAPYVVIQGEGLLEILRDVHLHQFLKEEIKEFLVIEEIERTIRDIIRESIDGNIGKKFEETFSNQDFRTPDRLEECSFRHYSIFISSHWSEFNQVFEHKQNFVRELINRVGDIRNQMFHFRDLQESGTLDTEFIGFAREHLNHVYGKNIPE